MGLVHAESDEPKNLHATASHDLVALKNQSGNGVKLERPQSLRG